MSKQNPLRAALLRPLNTAIPCTLFGADVYIRRLTAQELMDYDDGLAAARDANDQKQSAQLGAGLILSALVDETGQPIPTPELPTAAEILAVHDNAALLEAITLVHRHSYGTLEEAKKN
ncbi:phage tail protein [Martelella alba]|uniref:Phage tail protein n=1 Tax=Martelella alba TaxID=2590451 RepID=A0ABY2SDR7_9HYPH|nr:phage tail protein [Martelella alba]TKI02666.1 phage tail protein [Martelella alba]